MSLDVKFNRLDKTYRPGDRISGIVTVSCTEVTKHNGISLKAQGFVTLQLSARNMSVFESQANNKPLQLVDYTIPIASSGKLQPGTTEFPFEIVLKPVQGQHLLDTYHGVYVNVRYNINVEMAKAGMFAGPPATVKREFFVQLVRDKEVNDMLQKSQPLQFSLTPASLQNVREVARKKVPEFLFTGSVKSTNCALDQPFLGEIVIEKCAVPIKSIEIQLARVESCIYPDGVAREATEIQNIQVADGDVLRNVAIPLHMVFPRHFTCSTTLSKTFKIEFQVNLIVLFEDNHMITENFQIVLTS